MTHLNDLELLSLLEDAALRSGGEATPPARAAHLAACDACRGKLADLREALALAATVDVPEPSPMFWDHFSDRVRTSVQDAQPDARSWWHLWVPGGALTPAIAAAVLVVIVVAGVWRMNVPNPAGVRPGTPIAGGASARGEAGSRLAENTDIESDEAWALVRSVADEVSTDAAAAAGLVAPPGSADDAALTLTAEERTELVHLLRAETKRSGA